jgi:hypothetical protein
MQTGNPHKAASGKQDGWDCFLFDGASFCTKAVMVLPGTCSGARLEHSPHSEQVLEGQPPSSGLILAPSMMLSIYGDWLALHQTCLLFFLGTRLFPRLPCRWGRPHDRFWPVERDQTNAPNLGLEELPTLPGPSLYSLPWRDTDELL